MAKAKIHFVSYYTGPYDLSKPEIPYDQINSNNPVRKDEKYFDFLRLRFEKYGEDPREFIDSFSGDVRDEIKSDFEFYKAELLEIIKSRFPFEPHLDGFTVWYMINRYEPLMRELKPKILWKIEPSTLDLTSTWTKDLSPYQLKGTLDLPPRFHPVVKEEDIIEYCETRSKELDQIEQKITRKRVSSKEAVRQVKVKTQSNQLELNDPKKYYQWESSKIHLAPKVHANLASAGYIDCPLEVFEGAFGIREFIVPIKLMKVNPDEKDKANASLAIFLVRFLQYKKILKYLERQSWAELGEIIVKPDGKKFRQDFGQLNKHIDLLKPTKTQSSLAEVIENALK